MSSSMKIKACMCMCMVVCLRVMRSTRKEKLLLGRLEEKERKNATHGRLETRPILFARWSCSRIRRACRPRRIVFLTTFLLHLLSSALCRSDACSPLCRRRAAIEVNWKEWWRVGRLNEEASLIHRTLATAFRYLLSTYNVGEK